MKGAVCFECYTPLCRGRRDYPFREAFQTHVRGVIGPLFRLRAALFADNPFPQDGSREKDLLVCYSYVYVCVCMSYLRRAIILLLCSLRAKGFR